MEKIIVNLKKKRIIFFDFKNLPLDDDEEYTELPYALPKGIKLTDDENEKIFKEIMEDYNKRHKQNGLIMAKPFKLISKETDTDNNKRKLHNKIDELKNKRLSKHILYDV